MDTGKGTYPFMTANGEALTGDRLAVTDALNQTVAYNRMLVLACTVAEQVDATLSPAVVS